MAHRKQVVKLCDSCSKDVRAATTVKFSLNSVDYMIDLCEKHADAITRDFLSWARIAQEIERPNMFARPDAVRDYTRRPSTIKSPQPAPAAGSSPAAAQKPAPKPAPRPEISHPALEWTLSTHAEEQLAERGPKYGFNRTDVFLAVAHPERTIEPADMGGRTFYVRGNVRLCVNEKDKIVITVLPRSTRDFDELDSAAKYPQKPSASPFSHSQELTSASR